MKRKYAVALVAVTITTLIVSALAFKWHASREPKLFLATSHENVIDDLAQKRIRSEFGDRATLIKMLQSKGMTYGRFRQQVKQEIEAQTLTTEKPTQ